MRNFCSRGRRDRTDDAQLCGTPGSLVPQEWDERLVVIGKSENGGRKQSEMEW